MVSRRKIGKESGVRKVTRARRLRQAPSLGPEAERQRKVREFLKARAEEAEKRDAERAAWRGKMQPEQGTEVKRPKVLMFTEKHPPQRDGLQIPSPRKLTGEMRPTGSEIKGKEREARSIDAIEREYGLVPGTIEASSRRMGISPEKWLRTLKEEPEEYRKLLEWNEKIDYINHSKKFYGLTNKESSAFAKAIESENMEDLNCAHRMVENRMNAERLERSKELAESRAEDKLQRTGRGEAGQMPPRVPEPRLVAPGAKPLSMLSMVTPAELRRMADILGVRTKTGLIFGKPKPHEQLEKEVMEAYNKHVAKAPPIEEQKRFITHERTAGKVGALIALAGERANEAMGNRAAEQARGGRERATELEKSLPPLDEVTINDYNELTGRLRRSNFPPINKQSLEDLISKAYFKNDVKLLERLRKTLEQHGL